ncbi:hypothetical protein MMC30_007612 [Trapelia coarctata]|nr:hypothetical protein [Trapelia coarctata]
MASRKLGGVSNFVIRGSSVTGDTQDMKAEQQTQQPANKLGSKRSIDRQKLAEEARIKPGRTSSGYSKHGRSDYPSNVPPSAVQGVNGRLSNPASEAINNMIKHEHSQREANMHDAFDTDVENIDDTSTMSVDIQVKDSQSQANAHTGIPFHSNGTRRAPDVPRSSAIPAETSYTEEVYNRLDEDPCEGRDGVEDGDSQGEESEYSNEDEPAEEDPTLNHKAMNSFTIHGMLQDKENGEAFQDFLQQEAPQAFRNASVLRRSQGPMENTVRPSSQPNPRPLQESLSENHIRSAHPSAGNEGRAQAQIPSRPGAAVIPTQPAPNPNLGRHSDVPATPSRVQTGRSTQSERQGPQSRTKRPQVSSSDVVNTIPQHPKEVQGMVFEAPELRLETPALEPLSNGFTDDANGFAQEESEHGHKRALEPDYSEEDLSRMTYHQLKSEPFDHDPKAPPSILPTDLQSQPFDRQLAHIINLPHPSDEQSLAEQERFFASLPIDKYEECGDLILEKFGEIMNKFKKARQDKRQISRDFEKEVSRREALVTARVGALDSDMGRLRKAGQEVIRGKGP